MDTPTTMPGQSFQGKLPDPTELHVEIAQRLKDHVTMLAGEIGERNVTVPLKLEAAANYVERQLRDAGYEPQSQWFEAGGVAVRNIEVELRGTSGANEIVVIGAHYDSVDCPAANDNGSGVAALIEIARLLKSHTPGRTVRFVAFVNEEPPFFQGPLMGSVVYAKRCKERNENIVGMISLETIGYYSDAPGSQKYPPPFDRYFPDKGNFISFVGDPQSEKFVKQCIGSFRKHARFPSEGVALPGHITGIGWSDHWSFWQQGYPALMLTDTAPFRYPHYHRVTDTPDKIDYDRTSRVTVGMVEVVRGLASNQYQEPRYEAADR